MHLILSGMLALVRLAAPPEISAALLSAVQQDAEPGQAVIDAPAQGAALNGSQQITGTASDPQFARYVLEVQAQGAEAWQPIQPPVGLQVYSGVLGAWDTAAYADGTYLLRLRVELADGSERISEPVEVRILNATPEPAAEPVNPAQPQAGPGTGGLPLIEQPPTRTPRPGAADDAQNDQAPGSQQAATLLDRGRLASAAAAGALLAAALFGLWGGYVFYRVSLKQRIRSLIWQAQQALAKGKQQ